MEELKLIDGTRLQGQTLEISNPMEMDERSVTFDLIWGWVCGWQGKPPLHCKGRGGTTQKGERLDTGHTP